MEHRKNRIKLRLGTGFALIIVLMVVLSGLSIYSTRSLTQLTSSSYMHPLTVSNALREIRGDVYNIQKHLNGLVLTNDLGLFESHLRSIESSEKVIAINFDLVRERYLGELNDIEIIANTFQQWKPIREEIILLVRQQNYPEASKLVLGNSSTYVDSIVTLLDVPIGFAANKGTEFYSRAQAVGKNTLASIIVLSAILIVFSTVIGFFVSYRALKDLDDLQRYDEELGKSRKLESVGRLAGGIAHDFNNMLMPIMSYSSMMMAEPDRGKDELEKLEQINLAGSRAAELIKQLLAFSRKQILEMKSLNLNDVVREMEIMMRRLIGENIQLNVKLESKLGNVNADRAQIDQILLNIVVNARDAMPDGGKLTIETQNVYLDDNYTRKRRDVTAGDYVMLAVSDNGIGMEPETRDRIFEPFFTTKQVGKGTGLGMATIYGIVKQHDGHINVYSEPAQGTTFKVYLPLVKKEQDLESQAQKDSLPLGKGETVMVVEDERQVFELVCKILQENGYRLLKPLSAERALEMSRGMKQGIDLLLTDVIMPGMSGKQLFDKMQEQHQELKVVYMSGYTDNVIAHHGILDAGINFLQKPFTESSLLKKLRETLES